MRLPVLVVIASLAVALVQAGDGPVELEDSSCFACHREGAFDPAMDSALAVENVFVNQEHEVEVTLRNSYTHEVQEFAMLFDASGHQQLRDQELPTHNEVTQLNSDGFEGAARAEVRIPAAANATVRVLLEPDPLGRERTVIATLNHDRLERMTATSAGDVEFAISGLEAALAQQSSLIIEVFQDFDEAPIFPITGEVLVTTPSDPRVHVVHVSKALGPGESMTIKWMPTHAYIEEAGNVAVDLLSSVYFEHEAGSGIDDYALLHETSHWTVGGAGPQPMVAEETTPMPIWAGLAAIVGLALLRRH